MKNMKMCGCEVQLLISNGSDYKLVHVQQYKHKCGAITVN